MFIAVGKISDEARRYVKELGGTIEPAKQPDVSIVTLPDCEIMRSSGDHVYIESSVIPVGTLHFTRGWHTKDCRLDLLISHRLSQPGDDE